MRQLSVPSAVGVSIFVHLGLLVVFALIPMSQLLGEPELILETFFNEELEQTMFERELELETEISETKNVVSGGAVAAAIGGSNAPAVQQTKIEASDSLKEPEILVNVGEFNIPSDNLLGTDLGVEEVSGEVGAIVEGYGAALSRITQELMRLMRKQKVMAVWLFDESESMKDDQKEISEKFHEVYAELGIQQQKDTTYKRRRGEEVLTSHIMSFGQGIHELTKEPTGDIKKVRIAIDKIEVDESGLENMCQSISFVIEKLGAKARAQERRLIIIVVSDESPSDEDKVEEAIQLAKKYKVPVYILGREAIFGYPYARIIWYDPVHNLPHWVRINRGPETAYPECLQYNGLGARWDSFSSGFGTYSQVRIAKESGGIYFLLPGEEQDLSGPGAHEKRRFDALAMKEYQPLLLSRRVYAEQRRKSEFRETLWGIILKLNPHLDRTLNVRTHHYSIDPAEFSKQAANEAGKVFHAMDLLSKAIDILEKIKPQRATEQSQRWRANYDLIHAQCLSYRVRLFQYMLVMDDHIAKHPKPKKPDSNEWNFGRGHQTIIPDEAQFKRIKQRFGFSGNRQEYLAKLQEQQDKASKMYLAVEKDHVGTPWARRALYERKKLGFGMFIREGRRDPRYRAVGKSIKIPKF